MNILLSGTQKLDPEILDNLSRLPDTSIYLSLSQEDSQRIIKDVRPEVVIINAENSGSGFAAQVCRSYPGLEVYLYRFSRAKTPQLKCCNRDLCGKSPKLAVIFPALVMHKQKGNTRSQ